MKFWLLPRGEGEGGGERKGLKKKGEERSEWVGILNFLDESVEEMLEAGLSQWAGRGRRGRDCQKHEFRLSNRAR